MVNRHRRLHNCTIHAFPITVVSPERVVVLMMFGWMSCQRVRYFFCGLYSLHICICFTAGRVVWGQFSILTGIDKL